MFAPLLATASLLAPFCDRPAAHAPELVAAVTPDADPLKALSGWLKLYRKGRIEIYSTKILNHVPLVVDWRPPTITSKESFAVRYGIAPKGGLGDPTWLGDLELIAEALAKADTPEAAEALMELASVGLDGEEYRREMAPDVVRGVGAKWAAKLSSDAARERIALIARGELKTSRELARPMQGAALRCLGRFADLKYRTTIEPLLGHADKMLRFHAADALAILRDETSALALVAVLEKETEEVVLPAVVDALRAIYGVYLPKLEGEPADAPQPAAKKPRALPESSRLAARAALGALGRSGWRADMALLRFLGEFRTKDAIPALIGVLERYRDNPDQVLSGKLSTLVLHRAHELLVSMTGAVFPASQPEKWRELWAAEKDKIEVEKDHAPQGQARTAASGFAGIPVEGSRVVFILDLSRSMTFAMTGSGAPGQSGDGLDSRIDFARREFNKAIDGLSENASFNLITFDGDAKARVWSKSMAQATAKNREKIKKHVAEVEPDGGTNLWSALEEALKIKSYVYGDRYQTNVDEIFVLSDGAPTVGEVLDPIQILRIVKESNRFAGMRINTVFISSPNEEERRRPDEWMTIKPEELMKRLAEENGGKCVIL